MLRLRNKIAAVLLSLCGVLGCAAFASAQQQMQTPTKDKYHLHKVAAAVLSDATYPPSFAENPDWPFSQRATSRVLGSQFHVIWTDGTQSNIQGSPSQGYRVVSGDESGTTITPIGNGKFAVTTGDGGQQAVMSPVPGGGYTIVAADGTAINLFPRAEGGWDMDENGVSLGSIIPGPDGSQYGFGASSSFFSFRL